MRVNNLLGGTFIGVLLILVGLAALLRSFDINIPFGRIIIGILIIYVGFAILFGGGIFIPNGNTILFNSSVLKINDNIDNEYNVIFGSGVIDLTDINSDNVRGDIEVNSIFASSEVLLDSNKAMRIKVSSAFGKASTPDGNTVSFGDYIFSNVNEDSGNVIDIKVNAVFGGVEIKFTK